MKKLHAVIRYFCEKYPHKRELSKARLTKMVYLADWESAVVYGRQLTDIKWLFNHYGPYVDDVVEAAHADPALNVVCTANIYGHPKILIRIKEEVELQIDLLEYEKLILDSVIKNTVKKHWNDFIRYVYETYPILSQERYSDLNLISLAKKYRHHEGNA